MESKVATKKFLLNMVVADVLKEAHILSQFCHPYLPYIFGVVSKKSPYMLVMQYHGLSDKTTSTTLSDILTDHAKPFNQYMLLIISAQLAKAFRYLHKDAKVLHNDLKCNNVLVCDSITDTQLPSSTQMIDSLNLQVVVIDFGKATSIDGGKSYKLNELEKSQYMKYYPHIAPEVIEGLNPQSWMTDIFSLGGIMHKIYDHGNLSDEDTKTKLNDIAVHCKSPRCYRRPAAKEVLGTLEKLLVS